MGHERDQDLSARASPRIGATEIDGPASKRPKVETNSDSDDRQVSQLKRLRPPKQSHVIINLED